MIGCDYLKTCVHMSSVHSQFDVRIFHRECKTLAAGGYRVILIAQGDVGEKREGIELVALKPPRNRVGRFVGLVKVLVGRMIKERAEIYQIHDFELLPIALAIKIGTRAKVIYDVHEDMPEVILSRAWVHPWLRTPLSRIAKRIEQYVARRLDLIVAATATIAGKFNGCKVVEVRNYPILSVVDLAECRPDNGASVENYVVYAGGLERVRGTKEIIQAVGIINAEHKARLCLIGEFSESEFLKEVQCLDEWRYVDFLGKLPLEATYRHIWGAKVGLVCLHSIERFRTSLPNKLFEYMAAGIPVIASDFPYWREIVEGNECGLCVAVEPRQIAEAIEQLLGDSAMARRMGANGRRAVVERYNWDMERLKLLNAYETLWQPKSPCEN